MTTQAVSSEQSVALEAPAGDERETLIDEFVGSNGGYYATQFDKIGSTTSFTWTFNPAAALLGPIWFGMRHLWNWGLPFMILEAAALVQLSRGLFGDLSADIRERIVQIEATLAQRREQLEAAIANNDGNAAVFQRTIDSLEAAIGEIQAEAAAADAAGHGGATTRPARKPSPTMTPNSRRRPSRRRLWPNPRWRKCWMSPSLRKPRRNRLQRAKSSRPNR